MLLIHSTIHAATFHRPQHASCPHQTNTLHPDGAADFTWFFTLLEILLEPRLQPASEPNTSFFYIDHRPYPPHRTAHKTATAGSTRGRMTHYNAVSLLFGSASAIFTAPTSVIVFFWRLQPTSKPNTSFLTQTTAPAQQCGNTPHCAQNPPQQATRGGKRLTSTQSACCSAAPRQSSPHPRP